MTVNTFQMNVRFALKCNNNIKKKRKQWLYETNCVPFKIEKSNKRRRQHDGSSNTLVNIYTRRAICLLFGNNFSAFENLCHIFHINNSPDTTKSKFASRFILFGNIGFFSFVVVVIFVLVVVAKASRSLDNTLNRSDTKWNCELHWAVFSQFGRCHTSCHKRPKSINNFSNQLTTSIQLKSIEFNWQNKMSRRKRKKKKINNKRGGRFK